MVNIPKIIHYCWFGKSPIPERNKQYIRKWKKICPDYKFIKWSESNFNCNDFYFTKLAYNEKNWAALSDYVRLFVLRKYGGIYLDTDVEILKSLNPLLKNKSFIGLEDNSSINSGLIYGAIPNENNVCNILKYYDNESINNFQKIKNNQVNINTKHFHSYGFKYNNKLQKINGCTIYPTEYFCPQKFGSKELQSTQKTYTIHHYDGSWLSFDVNNEKISRHIREGRIIRKIIGSRLYSRLYNIYVLIKQNIKHY